ncbi:mesothelin-like protein [Rhinoderma darwinii]|uniref:mesothelin-like protein n=1 Tax=Rhinoderma darwinii TaxID=43563 RepID=UPI003F66558B
MYSTEEISQWNITAVDTLAAMLGGASWETNDLKISALVTQYLNNSQTTFDGTALTVLARYMCGLNETLIHQIPSNELRYCTKPLDVSNCTQSKKDLFFSKMKGAYASSDQSSNAYFQIMKPVIVGSKSEDLILFAKGFPEMDLTMFTELNPVEVKKLRAEDIKDLLGNSLVDINTISSSAVLQAWVSANTQTEINKLGLNVTSGANGTMPAGFFTIPVSPTSGASSHSFVYLLYICTLSAIFYINHLFL